MYHQRQPQYYYHHLLECTLHWWFRTLLQKTFNIASKPSMQWHQRQFESVDKILHNKQCKVLVSLHCKKILLRQGVPQGRVLTNLFVLFIKWSCARAINLCCPLSWWLGSLVLGGVWNDGNVQDLSCSGQNHSLGRQLLSSLNKEKTAVSLLSLSTKVQTNDERDTPLKSEDQQTNLNVTFDKRLIWKQQISRQSQKKTLWKHYEKTGRYKCCILRSMYMGFYVDGSATHAI